MSLRYSYFQLTDQINKTIIINTSLIITFIVIIEIWLLFMIVIIPVNFVNTPENYSNVSR